QQGPVPSRGPRLDRAPESDGAREMGDESEWQQSQLPGRRLRVHSASQPDDLAGDLLEHREAAVVLARNVSAVVLEALELSTGLVLLARQVRAVMLETAELLRDLFEQQPPSCAQALARPPRRARRHSSDLSF